MSRAPLALARLPIDDALPALLAAVRDRRVAVLVAPPALGKTTSARAGRDARCRARRRRRRDRRVAAAATGGALGGARGDGERGVELGREVGYEVRFDRKVSGATRIRFVTEGVLTRQLLADPELRGVGAVVIDEFHERHLDGDLALALVARLRVRRPELALIVMSATLDAEPVAAFLDRGVAGPAPIIRSEGRTFPIDIDYVEPERDGPHGSVRPIGRQVAAAVRKLAQGKLDGDVLVFLPGAGEIRRCAEDLADAARVFDLAIMPLHGDLTADEQDAAVRPATRRKVILATNVAETSVTIDGVVAVIDSGLARIARHSPWTGLPSLQNEPVSRTSCAQRAGRAGRTRPGRVIRLYSRHDHDTRRAFEVAEIARTDLAGAALELYGAGLRGLGELAWFETPPTVAAAAADELLARLGAISDRAITPLGRRIVRFPAHPRLGRLLCEAETRGVAREACVIAALLGTRELRLERRGPAGAARISSASDLIDDLDLLVDARRDHLRADRLRRDGLDVGTAHAADRIARQLERLVDVRAARAPATDDAVDHALQLAILTGFPDRVGRGHGVRRAAPTSCSPGGGSAAARARLRR